MAELHPGPDVSLGQLEAQLRELGLRFNQDYYYARVDGEWTLTLSDENYERWQENHGTAASEKDADGEDAKSTAGKRGEDEGTSSAKGSTAQSDDKSDDKSDTTSRRAKTSSKAR